MIREVLAMNIVFTSLLVFIHDVNFAQTTPTNFDSVYQVLLKRADDTVKVNQLNLLIKNIRFSYDANKLLKACEYTVDLSRRLDYEFGIAEGLLNEAYIHLELGNFGEMITANRQSREHFKHLGNETGVMDNLMLITRYYIRTGRFDTASYLNRKTIGYFDSIQDNHKKAYALLARSNIRSFLSDDRGTLLPLLQALEIFKEVKDYRGERSAYQSLGEFYQRQNSNDLAKRYFKQAITLSRSNHDRNGESGALTGFGNSCLNQKKFDSAYYYFAEAKKLDEVLGDKYGLGVIYNNMAEAQLAMKKYDEAITNYKASLKICNEIDDTEGSIYPIQGIAIIYIEKRQFSKADSLLKIGLALSRKLKLARLLSSNLESMAKLDSALGNYKSAFLHYKASDRIDDSLLNESKSREFVAIQTNFEIEEKENSINLLNKERSMTAAQQAKIRQIYLVIVVLAFVLILALLYIVRNRTLLSRLAEKSKREALQRNTELIQVNNELTQVMNQLEIRQRELENKNLQLEDLNREKDGLISIVAHDLRSPIAKTLGLTRLITMTGTLNNEQVKLIGLIDKVSNESNSLISDLLEINSIEINNALQPETIQLKEFMSEFIIHYKMLAANKKIELTLLEEDDTLQLVNYRDYLRRVLDNLLTNAIKFSYPESAVSVHYMKELKGIKFTIRDSGQGIKKEEFPMLFKKFKKLSAKPTAGESSTGLGLSIVKALLEKMDGSIEVESQFGVGSVFTIVIANLGERKQGS